MRLCNALRPVYPVQAGGLRWSCAVVSHPGPGRIRPRSPEVAPEGAGNWNRLKLYWYLVGNPSSLYPSRELSRRWTWARRVEGVGRPILKSPGGRLGRGRLCEAPRCLLSPPPTTVAEQKARVATSSACSSTGRWEQLQRPISDASDTFGRAPPRRHAVCGSLRNIVEL